MSDATGKARLLLEIRKAGVTNLRILTTMEAVPRDLFVRDESKSSIVAESSIE